MPIDAGNVVPIIQGHGSQRPRSCPWCPSCRSTTGNVVPAVPIDSREAVADHPGPRVATAAVLLPMIDAGKLLPIIQGHGPRLATAAVVPVVPIDSRERRAACRSTAGKLCADHPGPRVATAAVGARGAGRADHRPCRGPALRRELLPIIDLAARSGPVADDRRREAGAESCPCRSSRATARNGARGARRADRQPGRWCRSSTWLRGARRAGRVDHRPCRGPALRREAGARGAACRSTAGRWCRASTAGNVVPIIQGHGSQRCPWCPSCRSTAGKVVPIIDLAARCRRAGRADHRPCRGPALRREAVADHRPGSGARRAGRVDHRLAAACPTAGSWCPWCPCRSTAGKVVPIIDLAARSGPVADRRRGSRACRSSRATARNGARWCPSCRSTAGKVVPIIDRAGGARRAGRVDHRPCRGGARRADRRLVPIMPVATAGQRPRWCRVVPSCRSSTAGTSCRCPPCRSCRSCRGRARRADRRPGRSCRSSRATAGNGRGGARRAVAPMQRPCRSSRATAGNGRGRCRRAVADRRREACGARSSRATARNGARGARRADRQPGRWCRSSTWLQRCPSCRPCRSSTLPRSCPTAGSCCRSSTWLRGPCCRSSTAGNVVPALATAAVLSCRSSTAGNVVPVVPVPIDAGNVVPIIQGHGWQRPRSCRPCRSSTLPRSCPTAGSWCPWCRSTPGSCCRSSRATACNGRGGARGAGRASTAGKLLPIIQGHGSQRPRWCPSCRSTPGSCCRSSTWLRGPGLLPMIDAGKLLPASQRLPSCRPCRSTAGNVVPIIQGHGWQRPPSCPWCRSTPGSWCRSSAWLRGPGLLPMIDGGKVVPRLDSRERRADHPGPRVATAAVVPVVPAVPAVSIDGGNVVPIIQGRGLQRPRSCCRSSTAGNVVPALATAAVLLPIIDGGNVVPVVPVPIDSREAVADHPGPRVATAAVVPVVPAVPIIDLAAVLPYGGKLLPIIDLAARSGPVADDRRREAGAESCPCRSSRATARNGARGARRADRQPGRWCRSST